ncbi:MAG: amidohydrolase [Thermoplasmata archaeon]|nr:amidohydrolase [Thermoplasmata archaeon]
MMASPVDRAWVNGRVFTGLGFAEGFLVEGGTVRAVGADDVVRRAKGTGTEVVDLRGRLVLPGLIDLHMHLTDTLLEREGVDLHGARSLGELAERVRARLIPGSSVPLVGVGWDSTLWTERRDPSRDDLDRISTEQPLILLQVSMHAAVLNSRALAGYGIDEAVADPPGGRFGRDSSGRLNGLLVDSALSRLGSSTEGPELPRPSVPAYRRLLEGAASLGLTTICPVSATPEEIEAVATLSAEQLPVKVRFYLDLRSLGRYHSLPTPGPDAGWRIAGTKAITDGAFGTRTAWLSSPYADAPETSGYPIWNDEELEQALRDSEAMGLPLALHAIGDRALERVLALFAKAGAAGTPRVEHASLTPPALWPALEKGRPHLVVQPHFVETDRWVVERLGPERARWTYAFRTLTDHGFSLGGSSDSPVVPLDPWTGLRAAVFRAPRSEFGRFTTSERLAPIEAFQLYTRNGGRILGEPVLGCLTVGGPADFVVTSTPSLDAALVAERPPVVETWVGGIRRFPTQAA